MKRTESEKEQSHSQLIRELRSQFEKNQKEGKKRCLESLNKMSIASILVEVQEIIDNNNAACVNGK